MAIQTKPITLDDTKFFLQTLPASEARKVLLRLSKPIASAFKLGGSLEDFDLGKAFGSLSEEDVDAVSTAFFKDANVEHLDPKAGTSRTMKLPLVAEDLFAGPAGIRLWFKFMLASIELNFGDFSGVLGTAVQKLQTRAATESPSTSTGGSAGSSAPSTST